MGSDNLPPELKLRMEEAAAPFKHRRSALLAVLHAVQDAEGFVSPTREAEAARFLGMSEAEVHEATSFYTLFRSSPPARYRIQACRTLTCAVCGAAGLAEAVRAKLGLKDGGRTADGLFSFETVECLGACESAPALRVNDGPACGPLDAAGAAALLDRLAAEGKAGR